MKISVLIENTEALPCIGEHGLSLLAEYNGESYLVDTGASELFAQNAETMGVALSQVKAAFLSHAHYDHSSGFPKFFELNDSAKVYLQEAASQKDFFCIHDGGMKKIGIPEGTLENYPDRFVFVKGYLDLGNGITILPHNSPGILERAKHTQMFSGTEDHMDYDDFSHEQTVVFDEPDGLVCVNSCSHAGVDTIVEEIKRAFPGRKIKAFFGGFHMMGLTGADSCGYEKEEVQAMAERILQSSDAVFYSGHCTGIPAFAWLKEVMGDRIESMASGKVFEM